MKLISHTDLKVTTRTCHASTMAFYKNKPVFAWFGGYKEGSIDCSIYVQFQNRVWNVGYNTPYAMWNPILCPVDDKLFLFAKKGEFCDRWQTYLYDISDIDNPKFNIERDVEPIILPAGLNGPVKTKPVIYGNEIYCGSSVETKWDWTSYVESYNKDWKFIHRSKPLVVPKPKSQMIIAGIIQPALWIGSFNNLNAFFRSSHGLNKIYHAECKGYSYNYNLSPDHFRSDWTEPVPTKLDNPNSGIDVVYHNKRLFLAYNPYVSYRFPLDIVELDSGFNIIDKLTVENCPATDCYSPEFSYPYLVEHDDLLHLTYTNCRTGIKYCVINPK